MTLIQFDVASGQRIADTVRFVEGQANRLNPLNYDVAGEQAGGRSRLFRIATFTGAWPIGSSKNVTFKNQTTTPNTASATNLFFPINSAPPAAKDCAIAKDGTAWYLIDVPLRAATAVFVTSTAKQSVMSDVSLSATLNTNNCTITIGKTATNASITVATGTATGTYLQLDL